MTGPKTAYRLILVLAILCLGLAGACFILWRRAAAELDPNVGRGLDDPEVRRAAIAELIAAAGSGWDSFADAAVGRLLQPNLKNVKITGMHVSTNGYGMRERDYAMPKHDDTVRVVLLGDSFVMGQGVEANVRLGTFLERFLDQRAGKAHGPIECLHFGVDFWNTLAECTWMRRQLGLVKPDLVVQVLVRNDLEDNAGARGFGAIASFDPLHPERGDLLFQSRYPSAAFQTRLPNWLDHGLDWESRTRFEAAGAAIGELARAVEHAGGRFLLLDDFSGNLPPTRKFITSRLRPEQVAYLPTSFTRDERYRLSPDNAHWNQAGHELLARLLYALVQRRGLLPSLELQDWTEADELIAAYDEKGRAEAEEEYRTDRIPGRRKIASSIDFRSLDDENAAQVHGGVFREGIVAPYAALVLRDEGKTRLHLSGRCLPRPELDGAKVEVLVEEAAVGSLELTAGKPIDATFDVPSAIAKRIFVSVRFVSKDWVYGLPDLRQHQVFALDRVELE